MKVKGDNLFTLVVTFGKMKVGNEQSKLDALRQAAKVNDMSNSGLPEYICYLLRSDSYAHPADPVELLQTHISFIILAGRFVYKWKKSVDLGFLDFSTLPKRKYYCDEELRLNRRLCRDIYLERVHVSRSGKTFVLNGPIEDCVEYGIKMARLPQAQMMNEVLSRGELTSTDLQNIVNVLTPFYAGVDRHAGKGRFGTVEVVRKSVYDNFEQIRPFLGCEALSDRQFRAVRDYVDIFLRQKELFRGRKKNGFVRDCHGDLHSGNICLSDPIYIFDCIEFSKDLRITDIAADIAFLAMDLDFHGLSELSNCFVEYFIESSGDTGIMDLLNFYKCYRAVVRGKIGLLTANDQRIDDVERKAALENAARYFKLAERYVGGA